MPVYFFPLFFRLSAEVMSIKSRLYDGICLTCCCLLLLRRALSSQLRQGDLFQSVLFIFVESL